MKKNLAFHVVFVLLVVGSMWLASNATDADQELPRLSVSSNGHFLVTAEGKPFFWLGDTAWQLFHRLNREEVDSYLRNRAAKGFTVIQAVALAELDGLKTPNANGHLPLIANDPSRPDVQEGPDNDYWDHVDYVVQRANALGLYIGFLPTWGDKWQAARRSSPPIFQVNNARAYGRWLGERYRAAGVVWILGGDRNIQSASEREVLDAMAQGLREGDCGAHLITFHPRGPGQSSTRLHDASWLDLNMSQSSHGARDHDNGLFTADDYALMPPKPTIDGEPRYEQIAVGFYNRGSSPALRFDDYDVRQAAYWSLLAGACGHTYGHNSVWQMWAPGRDPVLDADTPWHEALDHQGAFQVGYVRRLFESRPWQELVPDDTCLVDAPRQGGEKVRAARAADGSFAFIYSPRGEPFTLRMDVIKTESGVKCWWFDPRYGTAYFIHTGDAVAMQTFVPPDAGRGRDWVLVLDDAARDFPTPGAKR
jgi:hypothetical protein